MLGDLLGGDGSWGLARQSEVLRGSHQGRQAEATVTGGISSIRGAFPLLIRPFR